VRRHNFAKTNKQTLATTNKQNVATTNKQNIATTADPEPLGADQGRGISHG
jgi:hypothetical protein